MSRIVCSFAGHSEIFDYDEAKGKVRNFQCCGKRR